MVDSCKFSLNIHSFLLFLIQNNRAVGNGGFAGGINWEDMVSCIVFAHLPVC